jgi:hypothetical protein
MKVPARTAQTILVTLLFVVAAAGCGYAVRVLWQGETLAPELGYADWLTVIFISLLVARGAYVFRAGPPLKTLALCVTNPFSFIFCFEAIYKYLFQGWLYKSIEMREMLLQFAATATILLGFHYGDFRLNRRSVIFGVLFGLTMAFWVAIGYPQLFMGKVFTPWLPIEVSRDTVYVINRMAKGFLFLAYFFLYYAGPRRIAD